MVPRLGNAPSQSYDNRFTVYPSSLKEYRGIWWREIESNYQHDELQSPALPLELPRHLVGKVRFELTTSRVSDVHSNQLNYFPIWLGVPDLNRHHYRPGIVCYQVTSNSQYIVDIVNYVSEDYILHCNISTC